MVDLGRILFLGKFNNSKKQGFGYEIDANLGNIYVGEFDSGIRHGKAEFYFMDKRMKYIGQINSGR